MSPARSLLAKRMRTEAAKKAPEKHYPAPYALIDLWEKHGGDTPRHAAPGGRLVRAVAGHAHVERIWCGCSSCAKSSRAMRAASGPASGVHVIGGGTMGADIAAWCAWNGLTVTLADVKPEPLGAAR